jgi:hypothetical protein
MMKLRGTERSSRYTSPVADTPQEAQAAPSAKGHAWAYLVVGLAGGLVVGAAGAWFVLARWWAG